MPEHDEHEHVDGCLCGADHAEHEVTPDHELPAARGGVEGDRKPRKRRPTKTAVKERD
jgi:hypothetical protein